MIRSRLLFLALLLSPLASMAPAHAHGSHGGGSELEAGEFDFTPLITVEGHAGYENNLRSPARHFAGDLLIGVGSVIESGARADDILYFLFFW